MQPRLGQVPPSKSELDHRDFEPGFSRGHRHTHAGVAAAEDHDIEAALGHVSPLFKGRDAENGTGPAQALLSAI
jgi:hypothetical protein